MNRRTRSISVVFALIVCPVLPCAAFGQQAAPQAAPEIALVERAPDPHGSPRPAPAAQDVALATSIFFQLALPERVDDTIDDDSVAVRLEADGGDVIELLQPGRRFVQPATGWLQTRRVFNEKVVPLSIYLEPGKPLQPATTYTVRVQARSKKGVELAEAAGAWSFTTAATPAVHRLSFPLDFGTEPVHWRGRFFSGICNVVFCTQSDVFGPTYALMDAARQRHPHAWGYQRDFWLTGTEDLGGSHVVPNIVRERETRRITIMETQHAGILLHVEDVFGHEQYGIPSNRPVSEDYHSGDEVLIADGVHDARTTVLAADNQAQTVLVSPFAAPAEGWKIAYNGPLPTQEDPDAPGLFAPGGCYLRKFAPHGTACYYWGRLDKEWDLAHRRYGRRVLVNFADAPWDLALDGRSWTTVKDYAQWHEVVRTITGHLIGRYGEQALTFPYSIFNEPDLQRVFWRPGWDELQKYYDYTTDAILRAFEDRGYDSHQVFVGGLELGGIFGTNLRLREFLAHCSPRATAKGALPQNAAFADPRLEGQRSRRVESLCRQHEGKGSPCDFISIHSYNRSEMMAAKLIRAKEMALECDPQYFDQLWINSHENCPDWTRQLDEAAHDSYLGNGYASTWCIDLAARLLRRATLDPRYACGETVLTVWPPVTGLAGTNTLTHILGCDDDGDGRADRNVTIPAQIFHVLTMLSDLGDRYWVLPEQQVGAHLVTGFASRDEKNVVRIVLYSQDAADTQSRSDAAFDVALELDRLGWTGPARVEEYRFDRDHNSFFQLAEALREGARSAPSRAGPAETVLRTSHPRNVYSREQVERLQELAQCRPTASTTLSCQSDRSLRLTARVAGNGLNMLVITPATGGQQNQTGSAESRQPE